MAMLMCMVATLFSCSKDEEEVTITEADVMGTWSVTSIDSDLKLSDLGNLDLTDLFSGEGVNLTTGYTLTLEDENELVVDFIVNSFDGSWKLDGKKLYLSKEDEEKKTEYIVQSINKETAVFLQPVTMGETSFNYIINLEKK